MRKNGLIGIAAVVALVAVGCTTSTDDQGSGGSGGSQMDPPYEPGTNGVPMNEQEACEALLDAFSGAASALQCTFTLPMCPAYIRGSGAPTCSQYDEKSILGCAEFYAGFDSCDDFARKPCHIHNILDSAPAGCPEDAGVDAEADAEGADAEGIDAAEGDAAPDAAEVDAGVDASEADGGAEPDGAATLDAEVADGAAAG